MLPRLTSLLRNLFRKHRNDQELDEEVRDYAELLAEEKMREGMKPEEARRAAKIELGGVEQVKERVREVRAGARFDSLLQDVWYALRMLRKNPGFTAVAVLTLALGIGANSAIFSLTYAVILKSLPVPNPGQLVRYTFRNGNQDLGLSGPLYDALRKHETSNTDLLAWSGSDFTVQRNGAVTSIAGALMSGNGFRTLELQPYLGRFFDDQEDVPGGGPNGYQAVLGFAYWKDQFQGSPDVLGQSLAINRRSVTVVGVLPRGFEGLVGGERTDIVLPLAFEGVLHAPEKYRNHPGSLWLTVMGRLKPGESLGTAVANLRATESAVREEADPSHLFLSGFFGAFRLGVESGRSGRSYLKVLYGGPLVVLEILVGLLLVLCCANTSLLVLARASSRVLEFAVRSALGAPRGRLFRHVLIEIGILACCGLCAGIFLGWAAAKSLVPMLAPIGLTFSVDVTPRAAILAFTAAISVFSVFAVGAWPALRASRVVTATDLKQAGGSSLSRGVGAWIVPVQVAVSLTLLSCASLLGGTFLDLVLENSGFHTNGVVMADVDLSATKLPSAEATQDAQQIVDTIENTRSVEAAGAMSMAPLHNGFSVGHFFSLGKNGTVHADMQTWPDSVTSDYFAAVGTPILEGRAFTHADVGGEPVCILGDSAAKYFFPGEQAVGKSVFAGGSNPARDGQAKVDPSDTCRVVGVAADARFQSLREPAPRILYQLVRKDELGNGFSLAVRSESTGTSVTAIREAIRHLLPTAPQPTTFTFNELVASHLRTERMLMALSTCFAGVALLLTALGLYGLLARTVVVRTKEIGLRLALGASPRDALTLVMWQGLRLVLIGAGIGIVAALGVTRLLGSLLYGMRPDNPVMLAGAVVILFGVALTASYIPAWRAARVDPITALRYE
jgi:predicted permease